MAIESNTLLCSFHYLQNRIKTNLSNQQIAFPLNVGSLQYNWSCHQMHDKRRIVGQPPSTLSHQVRYHVQTEWITDEMYNQTSFKNKNKLYLSSMH